MTVLWTGCGRCTWLGKISIVLISVWLLTIIISVNHVFKQHSSYPFTDDQYDKVDSEKLQKITNKILQLKKQNNVLRNLIYGHTVRDMQNDREGKNSLLYDSTENQEPSRLDAGEPSMRYEEARRRAKNNFQEMWFYVSGEISKMKKSNKYNQKDLDLFQSSIDEYKKYILLNMDTIANVDGFQSWREKESNELSSLVQERFMELQNPANCNTARKLICNLNKGCGFGCQIHHVVYCFLVAYGTERTLILKSKGWRYQKEGWESVFEPLSNTCRSVGGESHANWPGDPSKQILLLPIVDNVYPRPIFQPPAVPADIAQRLEKLHGYPLVWWIGQVLKFLIRPNNNTKQILDNKAKVLEFKKPIVGVHVRRTDKVGTEAAFHDIDEYMVKVQQYYSSLKVEPEVKRVFLASDDPQVITLARKRYPDYKFLADTDIAETASMSRRYSNLSLQGIIIDIHFLSLSDFLVCTFSSQVCRVAYELMQTHYIDAHDRFSSLDDVYYYGGQNSHPHSVIIEHEPRKEGEIPLKVGDLIEVYGNHWNGFSKGKNIRTGETGLFPSFKVVNPVKSVKFPTYKSVEVKKQS